MTDTANHGDDVSNKFTAMLILTVIFLASILGLLAVLPRTVQVANQQSISGDRVITVSGTGEVGVKPDKAVIVLGVVVTAKSASEAINEAALKVNTIVEALKKIGVGEGNIKTLSFNLYPEYSEDRMNIVGYKVNHQLQISIKDNPENLGLKAGEVVDKATANGANTVSSISFTLEDKEIEEYRNIALEKATAEARGKAELIAKSFNVKITGIKQVSESVYLPVSYIAETVKTTTFIPGTLEITASVTVTFTVELVNSF